MTLGFSKPFSIPFSIIRNRFIRVLIASIALFTSFPIFSHDFRKIRSLASTNLVLARKNSQSHLIVYLGKSTDFLSEIQSSQSALANYGYAVATLEKNNESEIESDVTPSEDVRALLRYAAERQNYRTKLLVAHGRYFSEVFEELSSGIFPYSALVLIFPGEAMANLSLFEQLKQIPEATPVYLVTSGWIPERERSRYLVSRIRGIDVTILNVFKDDYLRYGETAVRRITSRESFVNFLLLHRLDFNWIDSPSIFRTGCGFRLYGRYPLRMKGYKVSAEKDIDTCPLFLRAPGGRIYRASEVRENVCKYSDERSNIFCKY